MSGLKKIHFIGINYNFINRENKSWRKSVLQKPLQIDKRTDKKGTRRCSSSLLAQIVVRRDADLLERNWKRKTRTEHGRVPSLGTFQPDVLENVEKNRIRGCRIRRIQNQGHSIPVCHCCKIPKCALF